MLTFPYEDVALGAFVSHDGLQLNDRGMLEGEKDLDLSTDLALADYFKRLVLGLRIFRTAMAVC